MDHFNTKANKSIECFVSQCDHHCGTENFCTLDQIKVSTHESDPKVCQCVDCMSFEKK